MAGAENSDILTMFQVIKMKMNQQTVDMDEQAAQVQNLAAGFA